MTSYGLDFHHLTTQHHERTWKHASRMTRYEFYACADLPANVEALNPLIDDFQDTYNFVRPHGALSGLTPAEYHLARQAKENPHASHMS